MVSAGKGQVDGKPAQQTRRLDRVEPDLFSAEVDSLRGPVVWGYARVSTPEQDPGAQVDALRAAGVDEGRVVVERASGARADRPQLAALLRLVRPGDTVMVWKLDRLGRSVAHLVQVVDELASRQIAFMSITDAIDTNTAQGRFFLTVVAAFAELERELIVERTNAGLARARAQGKRLGRPSPITAEQYAFIHQLSRGGTSQASIARTVGVSRAAVGRVLRGEVPSLVARHGVPDDSGQLVYRP